MTYVSTPELLISRISFANEAMPTTTTPRARPRSHDPLRPAISAFTRPRLLSAYSREMDSQRPLTAAPPVADGGRSTS